MRHVRTEGGSRFFNLPIGSPITLHLIQAITRRNKVAGILPDLKGGDMLADDPLHVDEVRKAADAGSRTVHLGPNIPLSTHPDGDHESTLNRLMAGTHLFHVTGSGRYHEHVKNEDGSWEEHMPGHGGSLGHSASASELGKSIAGADSATVTHVPQSRDEGQKAVNSWFGRGKKTAQDGFPAKSKDGLEPERVLDAARRADSKQYGSDQQRADMANARPAASGKTSVKQQIKDVRTGVKLGDPGRGIRRTVPDDLGNPQQYDPDGDVARIMALRKARGLDRVPLKAPELRAMKDGEKVQVLGFPDPMTKGTKDGQPILTDSKGQSMTPEVVREHAQIGNLSRVKDASAPSAAIPKYTGKSNAASGDQPGTTTLGALKNAKDGQVVYTKVANGYVQKYVYDKNADRWHSPDSPSSAFVAGYLLSGSRDNKLYTSDPRAAEERPRAYPPGERPSARGVKAPQSPNPAPTDAGDLEKESAKLREYYKTAKIPLGSSIPITPPGNGDAAAHLVHTSPDGTKFQIRGLGTFTKGTDGIRSNGKSNVTYTSENGRDFGFQSMDFHARHGDVSKVSDSSPADGSGGHSAANANAASLDKMAVGSQLEVFYKNGDGSTHRYTKNADGKWSEAGSANDPVPSDYLQSFTRVRKNEGEGKFVNVITPQQKAQGAVFDGKGNVVSKQDKVNEKAASTNTAKALPQPALKAPGNSVSVQDKVNEKAATPANKGRALLQPAPKEPVKPEPPRVPVPLSFRPGKPITADAITGAKDGDVVHAVSPYGGTQRYVYSAKANGWHTPDNPQFAYPSETMVKDAKAGKLFDGDPGARAQRLLPEELDAAKHGDQVSVDDRYTDRKNYTFNANKKQWEGPRGEVLSHEEMKAAANRWYVHQGESK